MRFNDGGCDPEGRFLCGSMAYDGRPGAGTLYRLDADGAVEVVLAEVTISNGIDWSPDGRTAYYADTATGAVSALRRRPAPGGPPHLRRIAAADGAPDGLTVDAEGGVWVALYGGGAVRRYTPSGELDAVDRAARHQRHRLRLRRPGLDRLFITTTRENVPDGERARGRLRVRLRPRRRAACPSATVRGLELAREEWYGSP